MAHFELGEGGYPDTAHLEIGEGGNEEGVRDVANF